MKNVLSHEVTVCNTCGKVFPGRPPKLCKRCGARVAVLVDWDFLYEEYRLINARRAVAKWTARGWKIEF